MRRVAGDGRTRASASRRRRRHSLQSLEDPLTWIPTGSVDVVLCALAYHYVTNRAGFLTEVRRVLRDNGAVVISTHHPTFDWHRLGGSYFEVSAYTERWSKGWDVVSWRMPLSQMADEFATAGFVIERLVEPRPEAEMATSHPDDFETLSNLPGFVTFRLRKGASR